MEIQLYSYYFQLLGGEVHWIEQLTILLQNPSNLPSFSIHSCTSNQHSGHATHHYSGVCQTFICSLILLIFLNGELAWLVNTHYLHELFADPWSSSNLFLSYLSKVLGITHISRLISPRLYKFHLHFISSNSQQLYYNQGYLLLLLINSKYVHLYFSTSIIFLG